MQFSHVRSPGHHALTTITLGLALLMAILFSGCATYGDRQAAALEAMERGDYEEAETQFTANLADDDHELLFALELGVLHHLAGNLALSNEHFERADRLRDSLYSQTRAENVAAFLTSPSAGPYRGSNYEFAYVNYHKALNYLALAQETGDPQWLDAARIESRRLEIVLSEFAATEGDYLELASQEDEEKSSLARIIRAFQSQTLDAEQLVYRDDAWGRFLTGISYENLREWDNARVSYQQAAEAYEQGYASQYELGVESTRLAWTSVVRMMRSGGGWSETWPRLVEEKGLDEAETRPLDDEEGLLLVIEHAGRIAPVGELNLYVYARPNIQSIVIRPVATGSGAAAEQQMAWFSMHYGDTGVANLVSRYMAGGVFEVLNDPIRTKQVYLGPLWDVAESSGFLSGIGQTGMRVSVPWYPPAVSPPKASDLSVLDQQTRVSPVASIEGMQRQERLLSAQDEINAAIFREFTRNTVVAAAGGLTEQVGGEGLGMLVQAAGRASAAATARAETRHWASLPATARASMLRLPTGEHDLTLITPSGQTWHQEAAVEPGRVNLKYIRTFDPSEITLAR